MRLSPKHIFSIAAGIVITMLLVVVAVLRPDFIRFLDQKTYDTMLKNRSVPVAPGNVVVVDLDEESLAAHGQWPWPRDTLAELLSKINKLGAISIGLDMVLPEPDRTSPAALARDYAEDGSNGINLEAIPKGQRDHDRILADVLAKGPFVLGEKFYLARDGLVGRACALNPIRVAWIREAESPANQDGFPKAGSVVCNLPLLDRAVGFSGFMDVIPDSDGVVRRAPMMMSFRDNWYASLPLAVVQRGLGSKQVVCRMGAVGPEAMRLGNSWLPMGQKGMVLINYRGPMKTIPYVSATDILYDRVDGLKLFGKVAIVGTSAAGLKDLRSTPYSPAFAGAEITATLVDNIISGDLLSRPAWFDGLELMLLCLIGVICTLAVTYADSVWRLLVVLALGLATWYGSVWLLEAKHLVMPPGMLLFSLAVLYGAMAALKNWFTERNARQRMFELNHTQDALLRGLVALAECRDNETGLHITCTSRYVQLLASKLQEHPRFSHLLDDDTIERLYKMAPLHDIGKVGVPDSILLKPGRLTPEEFDQMKQHAELGAKVIEEAEAELGSNQFLEVAKQIALYHHEKWDGSGYPYGLKGDEIPLPGRLMAVADVYDALMTSRPYKEAYSYEKTTEIMMEGRGVHFDPDILDAFFLLEDEILKIANEEANHLGRQHGASAV